MADFNKMNPAWRLGRLDLIHPDNWKANHSLDEVTLQRIRERLRHCEAKTWQEILVASGHFNHPIKVEKLCSGAQKRLAELQIDAESLISLNVTGKERVWGVRNGNVLSLLWWDPNHQVYPVEKKYT